eukprot:3325149-Rhodomonas_salina.4
MSEQQSADCARRQLLWKARSRPFALIKMMTAILRTVSSSARREMRQGQAERMAAGYGRVGLVGRGKRERREWVEWKRRKRWWREKGGAQQRAESS